MRQNLVQPHVHPPQMEKRMSSGLDGAGKVAKEGKQERFTALLHQRGSAHSQIIYTGGSCAEHCKNPKWKKAM
jgi:hypothetical protein